MPPAARASDMHTCPLVTGLVPHVGGPVLPPGCLTVLIGFMPAARVGDMVTCVGPPDVIVKGSATVLIGGMPAARMGDLTAHGGVIVLGCPTVMIGDAGGGGAGGAGAGGGAGAAARAAARTAAGRAAAGATSAAGSAVAVAMAAAAETPVPPSSAGSDALTEAAEEGVATVEKCPLAHHDDG